MTNVDANLRKAAVLLRSLDADTAAMMLGRFRPKRPPPIRREIVNLGPLDEDEQANVMAELHRGSPDEGCVRARAMWSLSLSSFPGRRVQRANPSTSAFSGRTRFEFLDTRADYSARAISGSRTFPDDCRRAFAFGAGASSRCFGSAAAKDAGRNDRATVGAWRDRCGKCLCVWNASSKHGSLNVMVGARRAARRDSDGCHSRGRRCQNRAVKFLAI